MVDILSKIEELSIKHDKISNEIILQRNIKPGLRNLDGTGVIAGLTSKGQVKGFSKIKKIDGSSDIKPIDGKLIYCGYEIQDIINHIKTENRFGFEEIVYLLLAGELPNKQDLNEFEMKIRDSKLLPEGLKMIISQKAVHDDIMSTLQTIISACHLYDTKPNSSELSDILSQCVGLISKFPVIVAYIYLSKQEKQLIDPVINMTQAQTFLYLLNGCEPSDFESKLFDRLLVMYAEHGGGNNSTFAVRTVSSTMANTYMAISSGIASLSGPLHGGANEAVFEMINNIKSNVINWDDQDELIEYLTKILDGKVWNKNKKIYGLGHAVYTLSDPRSLILIDDARLLAKKTGREKEFKLYEDVAKIGVKLVFEKKGKVVCPNVDFYAAFILDALNIPKELFTPVFAMGRIAGWSAHRIEEVIQGRLIRPSYLPSENEEKKYVSLNKRD